MLFRVVVERKGKRTRTVEVRTGTARIGRAHGNDVRVPSAQVSRRHCQLEAKDGLVTAEDLESVNGTYLNDALITGKVVVRPGDRLEIGPITFVVEYELTPTALERLRAMDYDVVEEDGGEEIVLEVDEDEDTEVHAKKAKPRPKAPKKEKEEEKVEVEAEELDVVADEEEMPPLLDIEDVTWTAPGEGDLRDLLFHLDEGVESLKPKKRPAPRAPREDDEPPPKPAPKKAKKPEDKGGKRRPKAEE